MVRFLIFRISIVCVMLFCSANTYAHLLNMSVGKVSVGPSGETRLELEVDISREFKNRSEYFNASQIFTPLEDTTIQSLLNRIFSSIELRIHHDEELQFVDGIDAWTVDKFIFLEKDWSAYRDPLSWPKVRVEATLKHALPLSSFPSLAVRFKSDFIFEEPIAITLAQVSDISNTATSIINSKTRWLIAYQISPGLVYANVDGAGGGLAADNASGSQWSWSELYFYFIQGVQHVLPKGYDHMLFVMALALAFTGTRALLLMLSIFTLAHCLTLLTSVYGVVRIPAIIVEPMIALSIAWAGYALVRLKHGVINGDLASHKHRPPYAMIFAFGLLHGLGFAGAISELGLPAHGALFTLLVFNVGIELGQLIVMLLSITAAYLVMRYSSRYPETRRFVGYGLCGVGTYWTVSRLLF